MADPWGRPFSPIGARAARTPTVHQLRLLELDRAAGLRGEVVQNAADAVDLGGDAVADLLEERPIELGHLGGHGVDRVDGADERRPLVQALVVLHAGDAEVRHGHEVLPNLALKAGVGELLAQDGVGLAQGLQAICLLYTSDAADE